MTEPHICIVSLPLTPGGAERLVSEEAKYFYQNGCSVSIVTPQYSDDFISDMDIPSGIKIIDYDYPKWEIPGGRFIAQTKQIRRQINALQPDVIFSHYFDQEVYLAIKTISEDIPFVCQVNGSPFWFQNNPALYPHRGSEKFTELLTSVPGHTTFQDEDIPSLTSRIKAEIHEHLRQRALQESAPTFVISNQVKKEVSELYGIDPFVIRPGVSQSWIEMAEDTPNVNLIDEEYAILSVSRLDPRKRTKKLITAFTELRKRRSDIGLVIAGTGKEEQELRDYAEELGVEDTVKFTGYIQDEELPSYYKSADVFACPGWMSYGLTPLEAYSMGTKVALSTDAFVHEILGNQPGVEVVPPQVESWVETFDDLLGSECNINKDVVPTWETYCEEKHRILSELGVFKDGATNSTT